MDATASSSRAGRDHADGDKKEEAAAAEKVPLLGMFRYADRLDVLLMVVGTVGAVANGVSEPLVTVLFGNVINSFGESTMESILRRVSKVVLEFVYLGIGSAVVSFLRKWNFILNAVLRQDIAFFDTELTTGEAVSRMSNDTLLVQDALGEKVSHIFSELNKGTQHSITSHTQDNLGLARLSSRRHPGSPAAVGRARTASPPFLGLGLPAGLHCVTSSRALSIVRQVGPRNLSRRQFSYGWQIARREGQKERRWRRFPRRPEAARRLPEVRDGGRAVGCWLGFLN